MAEPEEVISEWEGDVLKRKKYSIFLTDYLVSKNASFVINLNAVWGSGKTFFISKWQEDIKERHPTVLFNAWKNDFTKDPLLSVISCINESLLPLLPRSAKAKKSVKSFLASSGKLLKDVSPILTKGVISKAIGEHGIEELSDISMEDEGVITDIVSNVTKKLIEKNEESAKAVTDFSKSLSSIIELVTSKGELSSPLIVFIDELDRCRPLYAIELLERIKHLFGLPEVVFVIATDTEQLSHSVKAIYGSDFDAGIYLKRFFDQTYSLPVPNNIEFSKLLFRDFDFNISRVSYRISASGESRSYAPTGEYEKKNDYTLTINDNDNNEFVLLFTLFSDYFDLDLRSQKQCFEKLTAILSTCGDHQVHFAYLIFLIMLEAKSTSDFDAYCRFADDQSTERIDLIRRKYASSYNVRVYADLYGPARFVEFYSQFVFSDIRTIRKLHDSNDPFRVEISMSLYDNIVYIKRYEQMVRLAGALS